MLQGCLVPLRQQVWSTFVGGSSFTIAVRTAKRKHLRIASRKKNVSRNKLKNEEEKQPFVPYKIRLLQQSKPKIRFDDQTAKWLKTPPIDDVWIQKYYNKKTYPILDAVNFFRESLHPTVYDDPMAPINLDIELNMRLEKDTKYLDNIKGIAHIPHLESSNQVLRSVVAICKTAEDQEKARQAGAEVVGSTGLINAIEKGELKYDAFEHLVCHTDSVLDIVKLRGLLKKKFPDKKKKTLGTDMTEMVSIYAKGYEYLSTKDWGETLYANLKFVPGRLDMPDEHIMENLKALVAAVVTHRPLEFGHFINKAYMTVRNTKEKFLVDLNVFAPAPSTVPKIKAKKGAKAVPEWELDPENQDNKDKVNTEQVAAN